MPRIVIELGENVRPSEAVNRARQVRQFLAATGRMGWEISLPDNDLTAAEWMWMSSDEAPMPEGMLDWSPKPRK